MRNYILRKYTTLSHNTLVIGHNGSCHTGNFFQTLLLLILLWILYMIGNYTLSSYLDIIKWIIGGFGIFVYIRFIIEFLNKYLDCLIINNQGIIIFERDGFLQYKLQQFDRDSIESITHSQRSLSDRILNKGSLQLTIEHGMLINFDNVSSPNRISNNLRNSKQQYGSKYNINEDLGNNITESSEKFEILVETLGEVIKDYMGKNKELPNKEKRDM